MTGGPLWLIPTRGRPDSMRDLIAACRATGEVPEAAVMIDDDPDVYGAVEWPAGWRVHSIAGHVEMVAATNELLRLYPGRPAYGINCDHARPRTAGWWSRLVAAAGPWGLAYSRDNWLNGCWETATAPKHRPNRHMTGGVVIGGELVRALGWIFPPWLIHLYVDNALEDVIEAVGAWRWCDDVVVEAAHPANGGRAADANNRRLFHGQHIGPLDRDAYLRWKQHGGFADAVSRVREAMAIAA